MTLVLQSLKVMMLIWVSLSIEHQTVSLIVSYPVSFTGSEGVGRIVGKMVQNRFGKVLLELGGNNGMELPYMPNILFSQR